MTYIPLKSNTKTEIRSKAHKAEIKCSPIMRGKEVKGKKRRT